MNVLLNIVFVDNGQDMNCVLSATALCSKERRDHFIRKAGVTKHPMDDLYILCCDLLDVRTFSSRGGNWSTVQPIDIQKLETTNRVSLLSLVRYGDRIVDYTKSGEKVVVEEVETVVIEDDMPVRHRDRIWSDWEAWEREQRMHHDH